MRGFVLKPFPLHTVVCNSWHTRRKPGWYCLFNTAKTERQTGICRWCNDMRRLQKLRRKPGWYCFLIRRKLSDRQEYVADASIWRDCRQFRIFDVNKNLKFKFLEITNLMHFFVYLFISCFYMFQASQRSSSGGRIVLIHHPVRLICVSDCLVCRSGGNRFPSWPAYQAVTYTD